LWDNIANPNLRSPIPKNVIKELKIFVKYKLVTKIPNQFKLCNFKNFKKPALA